MTIISVGCGCASYPCHIAIVVWLLWLVMTVVLLRGIINYCGGTTGGAFDESNGESGDI